MATEASLRRELHDYAPDITKVIIAQRIRSVEHADLIVVLERGEINGLGTHEELLKTNTIYQEIYQSQQKEAIAG